MQVTRLILYEPNAFWDVSKKQLESQIKSDMIYPTIKEAKYLDANKICTWSMWGKPQKIG